MATLPNIVVGAGEVKDLYAETGITVGVQIQVEMLGDGKAKLYSGASLSGEPTNAEGYSNLYGRKIRVNKSGDAGAFIWSRQGCTVNVSVF